MVALHFTKEDALSMPEIWTPDVEFAARAIGAVDPFSELPDLLLPPRPPSPHRRLATRPFEEDSLEFQLAYSAWRHRAVEEGRGARPLEAYFATRRALEILREGWPAVVALTQALFQRRALGGQQATELIEVAIAGAAGAPPARRDRRPSAPAPAGDRAAGRYEERPIALAS
eukprot:tig00000950_g5765.t1